MELLTVKQVAELLSVSTGTVYDLVTAKKLPHFRIGVGRGAVRIAADEAEAYLHGCRRSSDQLGIIPVKPTRRSGRPPQRLGRLKYLGEQLQASMRSAGGRPADQGARTPR